jgi:hypothetical protein
MIKAQIKPADNELLISKEILEASLIMDNLTNPVIRLGPEERGKGFSRHFRPSKKGPLELKDLSLKEINACLNQQIPKSWRKQIAKVDYK